MLITAGQITCACYSGIVWHDHFCGELVVTCPPGSAQNRLGFLEAGGDEMGKGRHTEAQIIAALKA